MILRFLNCCPWPLTLCIKCSFCVYSFRFEYDVIYSSSQFRRGLKFDILRTSLMILWYCYYACTEIVGYLIYRHTFSILILIILSLRSGTPGLKATCFTNSSPVYFHSPLGLPTRTITRVVSSVLLGFYFS